MIKLALIGAGNHSRRFHAPALAHYAREHPGEIELSAICDLDAEKAAAFKKDFGFERTYTDVDAMLDAEQPDGCVCVLPARIVAEYGVQFLERGITCMIEKPPGHTPEAARELLEAARRTGTPHMVSVNRRFTPYLNQGLQWARQAGPLQYVRASMFRHNRQDKRFIWGTGLHAVDALRHIAGDVREHHVHSFRPVAGGCLWFEITLRFKDGAAGVLNVMPSTGALEETYELFGENYRVRVTAMGAPQGRAVLQCFREGKLEVDELGPEGEPDFVATGAYGETSVFIRAIKDGRLLGPTVEQVYPSLELCFQIEQSCAHEKALV